MLQLIPSLSKFSERDRRCSTPAFGIVIPDRVTAASPISEPTSIWSEPIR